MFTRFVSLYNVIIFFLFLPLQDYRASRYIAEFELIYKVNTNKVHVKFMDTFAWFGIQEGAVGLCTRPYIGNNYVYVLRPYWEQASDIQKRVLIYHELGHCLKNRDHTNEILPDGCPKSLMFWQTFDDSCYIKHQYELLNELKQ